MPQQGAGDFGRRDVLHEVVDRRGAVSTQPVVEVREPDADRAPITRLRERPVGHRDVEEVARVHRHVLAQPVLLVRTDPEHPIETAPATGTRSGWATHVPSKPSPDSRSLSSVTFASATRLTSGSRRDGMNAAMPPIACAPRRWHVFTSSSVYARMNGTVIVTCARSGSTNSGRFLNFLMMLKM